MHSSTLLALLTTLILSIAGSSLMAADSIRVITDRTESHLKPLFKHFTELTGITVEAVYVGKGLYPRLEAQPKEADLVISKTAENLERARKAGLLTAFKSDILNKQPEHFVDPDKMYITTSYRPRSLFISKDRVKADSLSSYMDITKPEFKGKVAIRSGHHDYNVSLFCQMMEDKGAEATKAFITGLKANLARKPTGNDRAQVQAIHDGIADISIGNSYYLGIMMGRDDQRPWALVSDVFFPEQKGNGCYIMRAAAGLTKAERNVAGATKLLEYLVGDFAQYYLTTALHVYPVNDKLPISEFNRTLGAKQPEVVEGRFKAKFMHLRDIDKHREAVTAILNEVNFDK